jgi:cytochrome c-type biogenesis protein CcmH
MRALALWLALAGPALAIGSPADMLRDPAQESRAREIGRELRCLVCQNESIEDSNAELARDLRLLVRERIVAGDSDEQVVAFIHARYGDFVLLRPPVNASTILLWATPAIGLLGGGLAIFLLLRRRRVPPTAAEAAPELSPEEARRLAALEAPPRT